MFHILVVDDDTNTRRLLRAVLERENYTVSAACDGVEALAVMDSRHVDLVVLDVMMPKMDGYEFTSLLRENNSELPILMVSARHMPEDKKQGFLVGTDDYMTSPSTRRSCCCASAPCCGGPGSSASGASWWARWCWTTTP